MSKVEFKSNLYNTKPKDKFICNSKFSVSESYNTFGKIISYKNRKEDR